MGTVLFSFVVAAALFGGGGYLALGASRRNKITNAIMRNTADTINTIRTELSDTPSQPGYHRQSATPPSYVDPGFIQNEPGRVNRPSVVNPTRSDAVKAFDPTQSRPNTPQISAPAPTGNRVKDFDPTKMNKGN